jgi:hypothetical protein
MQQKDYKSSNNINGIKIIIKYHQIKHYKKYILAFSFPPAK